MKGKEEFKGSVSATVEEETQISLSFELEHVASTAKGSVNIVLRYTLSNLLEQIPLIKVIKVLNIFSYLFSFHMNILSHFIRKYNHKLHQNIGFLLLFYI